MENFIKNHINDVQKNFKRYNSLILKSKYDKEISEELIQTYIDARYYNFGVDSKIKIFYRRIYSALKNKSKELIEKNPTKKELIENHLLLFQYYFYFDNVRSNIEIDSIINSIVEMRVFRLNLRSALKDNFKEEFSKVISKDLLDLNELIERYDSSDFELEMKKVDQKENNYYKVCLKYNFEFPEIYSKDIIDEVFNSDIVAEDKLFVEYPMVALKIFQEILKGNFSKIYICDFSVDLLRKKNKLEQVLTVVDNQITQEKLYFKVSYKEFLDNKNEIFKLIKRGFCFALETNEEMPKLSIEELKILEIFSCIIVSEKDINNKQYKNIKKLNK